MLSAFHAASAPVQRKVQEAPAMKSWVSRAESSPSSVSRQEVSCLTKAELASLSVAKLRNMLSDRGVAQGNVSEKGDLVEWVHAHQGLPMIKKRAAAEGPTSKSKSELAHLSVAELHRMLASRGVAPGSASEKSELVDWVYQHQNLPVIQPDATHDSQQKCWRTTSRTRRRILRGNEVVTVEQPEPDAEDEEEEELKRLEAPDAKEEEQSSRRAWVAVGLMVAMFGGLFALFASTRPTVKKPPEK